MGLSHSQRAIAETAAGVELHLAHALLNTSRAWLVRQRHRRSVIDAGAAAEVVLGAEMARLGANASKLTLGQLITACPSKSVWMPSGIVADLKDPRNNSIHRAVDPTSAVAQKAYESARDRVRRHQPL